MTFDLERARGLRDFLQDDCAEVGDVWAEMIAEIERLRARDRQAAAAIVAMAEGAKQHVLKTHTIMKNVFDEADSLAGYCEELENIVITKDARIDELEADNQNLVTLNKSLMNNDWILRDNNRKYRKRAQKAELLNKELKSKIGPDARPKCDHAWQAAIEERGYQTCLKCGECRNIEDIPRTAPAWQITDERVEALWHAIKVLKENDIMEEPEEHLWDEEVTILQAMLTGADHDKP